jgi:hypothetical protein
MVFHGRKAGKSAGHGIKMSHQTIANICARAELAEAA